ncbi:MAG TPA: hypothetical protein PLI90_13360, partial [Rhodocyclaceae bacterium]|nr:hypothetical protein [Rhodocyclaceae bacterium]
KSACVRRGASSEVPGITVKEICFIAFCLSHRNDADGVVGFDMNNQYNQCFKTERQTGLLRSTPKIGQLCIQGRLLKPRAIH